MTPIARHRWILVAARGRAGVVASAPAPDRAVVDAWLARGLPLVARARQPGEPLASHPAGLSLHAADGRRRIALQVAPGHVASVEPPAPLASVAGVLSGEACSVARELAAHALALGFVARAFGSAAWQWRTGDACLRASSDLDLLAAPPTTFALRAWIAALQAAAPRIPMRLDGEVECPDGSAASWRELAGTAAQVLVKSPSGARLAPREALEAAWS